MRIKLHVGIATLFVFIVVGLAAGIVWRVDREARAMAAQSADRLFRQIVRKTHERANSGFRNVEATVDALSSLPAASSEPVGDGFGHPAIETMIRQLEARPNVYNVALAFDTGDWLEVIAFRDTENLRATFGAPVEAAFRLRVISRNGDGRRMEHVSDLNQERRRLDYAINADPQFDPTLRPWFREARSENHVDFSPPFVFQRLGVAGITAARPLRFGGGVAAVGVTFDNMSNFLRAQFDLSELFVFVFDAEGQIVAHKDPEVPNVVVERHATRGGEHRRMTKAAELERPLDRLIVSNALDNDTESQPIRAGTVGGERVLYAVERLGTQFDLDFRVAVAAPETLFNAGILALRERVIFYALTALAIALPLIYLVARGIAGRLRELEMEASKVGRFELEGEVDTRTAFREVHELALAFASMKPALRTFGRYVPSEVVHRIIEAGGAVEIGGRRQQISVMFTDVAGFTQIAEDSDPEELTRQTSTYLDTLGRALARHGGVVDKYVGDAVMALWNAPERDADHVIHACWGALASRRDADALSRHWAASGTPSFRTRFGLNCGEAVVGNVGGADRINFTALGATVNIAARLEGLNKRYGTTILISGAVRKIAGDRVIVRWIDLVRPVGATTPVEVYALDGASAKGPAELQADHATQDLAGRWEAAAALIRARDWSAAVAAFSSLASDFPDDRPTIAMLERAIALKSSPPPESWDGASEATSK